MIKLAQEGQYSFIETRGQTKILSLDGKRTFAWVNVENIGEILIASHKSHKIDHILSLGKYRIYEVKDDPSLTDLINFPRPYGRGSKYGMVRSKTIHE